VETARTYADQHQFTWTHGYPGPKSNLTMRYRLRGPTSILIGPDGRIWAINRCDAGGSSCDTAPTVYEFDASGKVLRSLGAGYFVQPHGLHVDKDGNVWIGTDRGLARWTPRGIVRVALPDSRGVAVFSLLRDRDSNIWVAAGARGVIRINTAGALSLRDWDARSNGVATALFEDRERNVWIGTTRGIVRIRDATFC